MEHELPFWKSKKLKELTQDEWESLCDGCGRCCFRKIIEGRGKKTRISYTRVACNLLDLKTCRCSNYQHRFEIQKECIKLNVRKLREFQWLPQTCAYRLVAEGKDLPEWHPLVSGTDSSVDSSGIKITNGIHEKDAGYWEDYLI